jgi:hypothetical protein
MSIPPDAIAKAKAYVERRFGVQLPQAVLQAAAAEAEKILTQTAVSETKDPDMIIRDLGRGLRLRQAANMVALRAGPTICANLTTTAQKSRRA